MRFALTVMPVMMLCGQAQAAGLTSAEMRQMQHYTDAAKRACPGHEADALSMWECTEKRALSLHADRAQRQGDQLILTMPNGKKIYQNQQGSDYVSYNFLGYLGPLDAFVIRHWFAMDVFSDFLVMRNTGKEIELYGSPFWDDTVAFSADGTWMLDYSFSETGSSGFAVYRYDRTQGFTQVYNDSDYRAQYPYSATTEQPFCFEWVQKTPAGKQQYLTDFHAKWLVDRSGEIDISTQYSGNSYYNHHICSITSH